MKTTLLGFALGFALITNGMAGSAMWKSVPADDNWYNPNNWTPTTVPNGPTDLATFGSTTSTNVTLPAGTDTLLDGIIYGSSATPVVTNVSAGASLTFTGRGALNNGGQSSSRLGSEPGSTITFQGIATASIQLANEGEINFQDQSALTALVTCYAGFNTMDRGSVLVFSDQSQAINTLFLVNGGSTATNSSQVYFNDDSTTVGCAISLYAASFLDISGHHAPGLTISSIGGDTSRFIGVGSVFLGGNNLTLESGSFLAGKGVISDGGASGGSGGSLTKVSDGILTLNLPNTYTGGTTVTGGTLVAGNKSGSATGTGPVQITTGTLGGSGTISGAVTIGGGGGMKPVLAPIANGRKTVTLTILSELTLASDGTYYPALSAKPNQTPTADEVVANGVAIAPGAKFRLRAVLKAPVSAGTVFTVISNTSASPISGTFANLHDGGTVKGGGQTFQANYEGGDGNDLTLTVQP